jgi:uncharacterized protein YndB with AHSA1/START domain
MNHPGTKTNPQSETGMLIRRPPAEVFEAFVDPGMTSNFWFSRGSDRLEVGREVRWDWEMYDISVPVTVRIVEPSTRIVIGWPGYSGPTSVEWTFDDRGDGTTFVTIQETGFASTGDELVEEVADSTQGFTIVLAGLKAYLEHGIRLGLVGDRYPDGRQ